jgi:transcription termination factor Rho
MNINSAIKLTELHKFLDDESIKTGHLTLSGTLQKIANGWAFIKVNSVNYSNNRQVKVIAEGQIIRRRLAQITH